MRIETWSLKKGDHIEINYHAIGELIVELTCDPYEQYDLLLIKWKSLSSYSPPISDYFIGKCGAAIYNEQKTCWDLLV